MTNTISSLCTSTAHMASSLEDPSLKGISFIQERITTLKTGMADIEKCLEGTPQVLKIKSILKQIRETFETTPKSSFYTTWVWDYYHPQRQILGSLQKMEQEVEKLPISPWDYTALAMGIEQFFSIMHPASQPETFQPVSTASPPSMQPISPPQKLQPAVSLPNLQSPSSKKRKRTSPPAVSANSWQRPKIQIQDRIRPLIEDIQKQLELLSNTFKIYPKAAGNLKGLASKIKEIQKTDDVHSLLELIDAFDQDDNFQPFSLYWSMKIDLIKGNLAKIEKLLME